MKKTGCATRLILAFALTASCVAVGAQTADQAWLKYPVTKDRWIASLPIRTLENTLLERSAAEELTRSNLGFVISSRNPKSASESTSLPNYSEVVLGTVLEVHKSFPQLRIPSKLRSGGYWLTHIKVHGSPVIVDVGEDDRGVLYGAFALLSRLRRGQLIYPIDIQDQPAMPIRWVDEWDNADGSIERGYAGRSIFFDAGHVRDDLAPVADYARLLASVGINGCNLNNVNNAAHSCSRSCLREVARIADAMRPWGVRVALSVDIASPQKIGGLATYDPLDPAVKAWWAAKTEEIYKLIPDFAGFTVKADSEGQPGPASYGRTPADAANLLANALAPHGGVVLYRAFVYNHHLDWNDPKADRARAAYDIFHPLDGKFAANVIVQTKEGPIDFQAREPVSPLFGGLEHTSQAMEVQITQEYTGQQRHLVYLAPMWKQVLDFDMRAENRCDAREGDPCRQDVSISHWAEWSGWQGWDRTRGSARRWRSQISTHSDASPGIRISRPEQIADEWTRQTISNDPVVVSTVTKMLMQSWPAYEHYTGPLGMQTLTDITGTHYGPNIEASENNGWGQWHRADHDGVGMDRTVATGTGYAGQYPPEVAKTVRERCNDTRRPAALLPSCALHATSCIRARP